MTEDGRPDLDLLADLDAGLLDDERAAAVRAAAAADPRCAAELAALGATRADLAALPLPPVPAAVAGRWAQALETEALETEALRAGRTGTGRPADGSRPDSGRRRGRSAPGRRRGHPVVLAAVLLTTLLGAGLLWSRPQPPAALDRVDLAAAGRAALGSSEVGALADPARRAGCLRAVTVPGLAPGAPLLGGREVEIDRRRGVLLVLGTGQLGVFRIVVVDPDCGPGGGTLLDSAVAGR